jgi:hypothetical protein
MSNDRGFQSILRPDRAGEDHLLEELAAKKGISRLQSPPGPEPTPPQPTPRPRIKSMNLELPDYVMRALKEMALRDDCSVRHIIMRSLAREGIPVQPADMIADGRRLRGKNVPM